MPFPFVTAVTKKAWLQCCFSLGFFFFFRCSFAAWAVGEIQSSALKRSCIPQWQQKKPQSPLVLAKGNNTCKHNSLKQTKKKQKQIPNCNWRFLHHYRQQPEAVTDTLGESLARFIDILFGLLWVDMHNSWPK